MNELQAKHDELSPEARDFHTKEWELLRNDVRLQIEQSKYLEYATVVAISTFYAWFISSAKPVPRVMLFLPTLLVILGGLRAWGTLRHIQRMGAYIKHIETGLSHNAGDLIGWDRTRSLKNSKSPELKLSASLFWLLALAVTIASWWLL